MTQTEVREPGSDRRPRHTGRDLLPTARRRAFIAYVAAVVVAAVTTVTLVALDTPRHGWAGADVATWLIAGFVVLDALQPLVMPSRYETDRLPVSVAFLLALTVTTGPLLPFSLVVVTALLSELSRGRAPWRAAFNAGQYCLAWAAAWLVLLPFGMTRTGLDHQVALKGENLLALVLAAATYLTVNNLLVATAVALRGDGAIWRIWCGSVRSEVATALPLMACAPLVVAVMQNAPWLVPLLLLPLAAVHLTVELSRESEHHALYDGLTGLPNRTLLRTRIEALLADPDQPDAALLLLDIDRFKEVNDTLGHDTGDQLLAQIALRLTAVMRPGDVVARLGGDEFALLLPGAGSLPAATDVAARVSRALEAPFEAGGMLLQTEGSIGVALFPEHARSVETLFRCADVAMYQAKASRQGVEVYDPADDHHSAERLALLGDLRLALDQGGLEVHFQPMADARTARIAGVEALVRWPHPRLGMVPPDDFVPLAEQSGLMRPMTEFVLSAALEQVAGWRRSGTPVSVSVNVSARDLCDRGFVPHVRACLQRNDIPGNALVLEVTERVLADDDARALTALEELTGLGVHVSLDDFGTGYSSLGRLMALPVGEIKVDKSFVSRLDVDDDAPIVRSMIELAHSMGLSVVAEGVETARAWRTLSDWGCDVIQGWYLARAMPAPELSVWLREHRSEPLLRALAEQGGLAPGPLTTIPAPR